MADTYANVQMAFQAQLTDALLLNVVHLVAIASGHETSAGVS